MAFTDVYRAMSTRELRMLRDVFRADLEQGAKEGRLETTVFCQIRIDYIDFLLAVRRLETARKQDA